MHGLLFAGLLLLVGIACGSSERQAVTLVERVELPAGRVVELRAPEPLRTPAYSRAGVVCLTLTPPLRQDTARFAIRTGTGRRVVPIAAAVRADGRVDTLRLAYYLGPDAICLSPESASTLHPPYVAVRLTSSEPLALGRVEWLSTDK
jgi:hypothetical protein